jgi:hypothetical protein
MKKLLLRVKEQFPTWDKVLPVYAVITFVIYGWSLYWFLHELPAWLHYLQLTEIISLYSYVLMVNFLESLLILFFLLILCVALPQNWLFDKFIYRGSALSLFIITYMIAMIVRRSQIMEFSTNMVKWFPVILIIALLFIIAVEKFSFIKKSVEGFADRATIFLYINIPASIMAIVFIMIRAIR